MDPRQVGGLQIAVLGAPDQKLAEVVAGGREVGEPPIDHHEAIIAEGVGQEVLRARIAVSESVSGGLFAAFTILAGTSIAAAGLAVILGGALPVLVGWIMVSTGAVIVGGYLIAGDMPPFVAYLPTGALGLALLLSPS